MEAMTHLLLQISILRFRDMYFSYMFPKHGELLYLMFNQRKC